MKLILRCVPNLLGIMIRHSAHYSVQSAVFQKMNGISKQKSNSLRSINASSMQKVDMKNS